MKDKQNNKLMMKTRKKIEKLERSEKTAKITFAIIMLIILIGLSTLSVIAQPTDSVSYETVDTYSFIYGEEYATYKPGIIFEFQGDKIIASTKDQTKNLYLKYKWKDRVLDCGDFKIDGKVVEALDNGGFSCLINYGYHEESGLYIMSILYKNVTHVHWMKPTNKEARPEIIETMVAGDQMKRDYTDEEVKWFMENFGFLMGDFYSLSWLD